MDYYQEPDTSAHANTEINWRSKEVKHTVKLTSQGWEADESGH